jgi:hypothetical protein
LLLLLACGDAGYYTLHHSQAASLRGMVWVKNPPALVAQPLQPLQLLTHTSAIDTNSSTDAAPTSNVPSTAHTTVNSSANSSARSSSNVHSSVVKSSNTSNSCSTYSTGWSLQGTSGMTKDDAAAADTVTRALLLQASLMSGGGARSALDKRWRAMTGSSLLQPHKLPTATASTTSITGNSSSKSTPS